MDTHTTAIRRALAEGKPLWRGLAMIDEEAFYVAIVSLRRGLATLTRSPHRMQEIDAPLQAMESLVENGKGRFAGRVIVRPADFEPHLQVLEEALRGLPKFVEPSTSPQEMTIEEAKLEAARIIEDAHREADEIRRRAREGR